MVSLWRVAQRKPEDRVFAPKAVFAETFQDFERCLQGHQHEET